MKEHFIFGQVFDENYYMYNENSTKNLQLIENEKLKEKILSNGGVSNWNLYNKIFSEHLPFVYYKETKKISILRKKNTDSKSKVFDMLREINPEDSLLSNHTDYIESAFQEYQEMFL